MYVLRVRSVDLEPGSRRGKFCSTGWRAVTARDEEIAHFSDRLCRVKGVVQ
jgi:hypothetical protein